VYVTEKAEQTIAIEEHLKIDISTGSGSITVKGEAENEVKVVFNIRVGAENEEEAKRVLNKIIENPPIEKNAKTLVLGDLSKYNLENSIQVSIDFVVTAPFDTSLEASSGSGSYFVANIKGPVNIDSGSGAVLVKEIKSEVIVDTGSGSVSLADISGNVLVDVGSGRVALKNIDQNLKINTGSGSVGIESHIADGTKWEIDTGSGRIKIELPEAIQTKLRIDTGSGRVNVGFPLNNVKASGGKWDTEGEIGENPTAAIEVDTGSGSVEISSR